MLCSSCQISSCFSEYKRTKWKWMLAAIKLGIEVLKPLTSCVVWVNYQTALSFVFLILQMELSPPLGTDQLGSETCITDGYSLSLASLHSLVDEVTKGPHLLHSWRASQHVRRGQPSSKPPEESLSLPRQWHQVARRLLSWPASFSSLEKTFQEVLHASLPPAACNSLPQVWICFWRTEPKMWLLSTLWADGLALCDRGSEAPMFIPYLPIYLPQTHPVPISTVQQTKCAFCGHHFWIYTLASILMFSVSSHCILLTSKP